MSKILVTGGKGQLGRSLRREMPKAGLTDVRFIDIDELDLADEALLERFLSDNSFDVVVNCAAYTAVDKAEDQREEAYAANAKVPADLGRLAGKYGFRVIHISTDYVFTGTKSSPYLEEDIESEEELKKGGPKTVYGSTKLEGETLLLQSSPESIVIRTSWLYSEYGRNFVKTMWEKARENADIKVVADQIGSPTYAGDLALAIIRILQSEKWKGGVYHFCNSGEISWFDLAKAVYEDAGGEGTVTPIATVDYPTKAKRPMYSVLDTSKIRNTYGVETPDWRGRVAKTVDYLKKQDK